jgi:hypothetical protein
MDRRHQLETRHLVDLSGELVREGDMLANQGPKPFEPIAPNHKPQLQGPEPASQLDTPVAVVHNLGVLSGPQILRSHLEGAEQRLAVAHEIGATIEVHQHPFMRIEYEAVRLLDAVEEMAQLRNDGGRPGVGRVNVEPDSMPPADFAYSSNGVDCGGGSSPHGGYHTGRDQARFPVGRDHPVQRIRHHGIRLIDRHPAELLQPVPRELDAFVDRRVRFAGCIDGQSRPGAGQASDSHGVIGCPLTR